MSQPLHRDELITESLLLCYLIKCLPPSSPEIRYILDLADKLRRDINAAASSTNAAAARAALQRVRAAPTTPVIDDLADAIEALLP